MTVSQGVVTTDGPPGFNCSSVGMGEREYPHRIAWRRMPDALVLRLETGTYVLDLHHERQTVRPGDVAIVPPEAEHRIHMPEESTARVVYAHVAYTMPDGLDLFRTLTLPVVVRKERAADIGEILHGLVSCSSEPEGSIMRVAREQELGFRLLRMLISCGQFTREELLQPGAGRLRAVLSHIEKNLDRPIARNELAQLVDLSPSRFHDVFRKALGVAPLEYVQQQRMARAKRLLLNTDLTIFQVAARTGYEDPYYFSRLFSKTQGMSPSAFRKNARESGF